MTDDPNRNRHRSVHLSDVIWDWTREYADSIGTSVSHVIETRLIDLHDDVTQPDRAHPNGTQTR